MRRSCRGCCRCFWLTNLGMNHSRRWPRARLCRDIFMEAFWTSLSWSEVPGRPWDWCSVICAATFSAFALHWSFERGCPSLFNIQRAGDLFGTPIVANPSVLYSAFALAPMVNAGAGLGGNEADLIGRVISVVPWTAPARHWRRPGRWAGISGRRFWSLFWPACRQSSTSHSLRVCETAACSGEAEEAERAEQRVNRPHK